VLQNIEQLVQQQTPLFLENLGIHLQAKYSAFASILFLRHPGVACPSLLKPTYTRFLFCTESNTLLYRHTTTLTLQPRHHHSTMTLRRPEIRPLWRSMPGHPPSSASARKTSSGTYCRAPKRNVRQKGRETLVAMHADPRIPTWAGLRHKVSKVGRARRAEGGGGSESRRGVRRRLAGEVLVCYSLSRGGGGGGIKLIGNSSGR